MYDDDLRSIGYRRKRTWPMRHPVATRVLLLAAGFVLLAPLLRLATGGDGDTVRTQSLPGAAIGADRILTGASTSIEPDSAVASDSSATDLSSSSSDAVGTLPATVPSPAALGGNIEPSASATNVAPRTTPPTTGSTKVSTGTTVAATTRPTSGTTSSTAVKSTTVTSAKAKPTTTTTAKPKVPPTTTTTAKPKPTTTTTVPRPTYGQAQVISIIRSVWPADLQDKALQIAWRESNDQPTAKNWCCYGLFQINATANAAMLRSMGVTPDQLFDPLINSKVAYAMYLRSGWAPWGG